MNKTKSIFVAAVSALALMAVGCTPVAAMTPSGAVGWEAVENGTPRRPGRRRAVRAQ